MRAHINVGFASSAAAVLAAAAMFLLSAGVFAQHDEREREKSERVADILTALGVRDGAHVADLGSADGFYTLRIAKAVAPSGKAYAIDIDRDDAFTRFTARTIVGGFWMIRARRPGCSPGQPCGAAHARCGAAAT